MELLARGKVIAGLKMPAHNKLQLNGYIDEVRLITDLQGIPALLWWWSNCANEKQATMALPILKLAFPVDLDPDMV